MGIYTIIIAAQLSGAQPATETPPPATDTAVPTAPATTTQPAQPASGDAASQPATKADDAIVVKARGAPPPEDPLQGVNLQSYAVVQTVDKAVTGPVARSYKKNVPSPLRSGLRNALRNLAEPIVFVNFVLQHKIGKSAETVGRFAINSTVGVAGLFDVAKRKPINLPPRINGFAYTMGFYGVKPGPYMYLPLIGPTTVRDLVGRIGDISLLPFTVGTPFNDPAFTLPTTTVRLIDERAEAEDEMQQIRDGNSDPYSSIRSDYLAHRQAQIDALHTKRHKDGDGAAKPGTPPPPAQ